MTEHAEYGNSLSVSVVIPTRDRIEFVSRAISTVLSQKDVTVEVVVVDDGSVTPVPKSIDPRVRVLRNTTPEGVSRARNRGIAVASHRWIAFLDDDDFWAPTKLADQLEAITKANARWCVSGAVLVDSDAEEIAITLPKDNPKQVAADLCEFNAVPGGGSGVLLSRDLIAEFGPFDEELSMVADWEFWHRIAHRYPCALVRQPLVAYTVHDLSMTQTFDGYDGEMKRMVKNSSTYCPVSLDARRTVYDDWLASHLAKTQPARAARLKARSAVRNRSPRDLLTAARYLVIPHSFSGRRALGLPPKHDSVVATPWLQEFRRQRNDETVDTIDSFPS